MPSKSKSRSKVNSGAVMEEIKNLAFIGAGVVAGSIGGRMVDKALKVDSNQQGFNAKGMVRPALLIGAGTYAAIKSKNRMVRMLSAGIGAAGVLSGIKALTKKDLLAGAEWGLGETFPLQVYREPLNLSMDRYNPDLPVLSPGSSVSSYDEPVTVSDDLAAIEII